MRTESMRAGQREESPSFDHLLGSPSAAAASESVFVLRSFVSLVCEWWRDLRSSAPLNGEHKSFVSA